MIGGITYVFVIVSELVIPSSMKKLLRFVAPLIAGNVKEPTALGEVHPEAFCETLTGDVPGLRVSSCVKFLPLSGRSTTCSLVTTEPSSAVEASTAAPTACTVTDCCTAPTVRVKSNVAV